MKLKRIAALLFLSASLTGCTASHCAITKKAIDSAEAVYQEAKISGQFDRIERAEWALKATEAAHAIICAGVEE